MFTKNGHIKNSDSSELLLAKAEEHSIPWAKLEMLESQAPKSFV